jgi:predicted  nucleic acid-binding Zn-ribbon protein
LKNAPVGVGAQPNNANTARMQKELALIRDEWTAANDKCAKTQVEIEASMKALTRSDKQLKGMQDAVKRAKQEYDRDVQTANAAKAHVTELVANYPGGPTARTTDRRETVYEARVQKAETVQARAERHMQESKTQCDKKQKDLRELEESVKAEEQNLKQLKSRFDGESRILDNLEKRIKGVEERLQESQQASQFGA